MASNEGKVKDLVEKLKSGEITKKEAKRIMTDRGLCEQESWTWGFLTLIVFVVYFSLCLLSVIAKTSKIGSLEFFAQLPVIHLPMIVIYASIILLIIGTVLSAWANILHRKKGGFKETGETIIFYREGPFRIMRHPCGFGLMLWFILPFIILSPHLPFTILSVAAIILMIVYHYYMFRTEEKYNILKWGDEYGQYMKEVPRFNFIKGLWNLRKRRK